MGKRLGPALERGRGDGSCEGGQGHADGRQEGAPGGVGDLQPPLAVRRVRTADGLIYGLEHIL